MEKDKIGIRGQVRLQCYRKDGSLKWDTGFMKNTITNASLAIISALTGGVGTEAVFDWIAVGTSSAAESPTHTALTAEITDTGLERAQETPTRETTNQTNDTLQISHTWSATGTKIVEEVGVFNAASAGDMFGRKLTTTKTVNNGEQLIGTYQYIFA